jgi:hypothetical protein
MTMWEQPPSAVRASEARLCLRHLCSHLEIGHLHLAQVLPVNGTLASSIET